MLAEAGDLPEGAPGQLRLLIAGDGVYATQTLPSEGTVTLGRAPDNDIAIDEADGYYYARPAAAAAEPAEGISA